MKAEILNYYISEKQWAANGLWIAIAVVVFSVILWRTAAAHSLWSGLSYTLAIGGWLFIIATSLTIRHNNQRIAQTEQLTEHSGQVLQQQETARMENVIKNAYKAGLISFSIALITGVILLFVFKTPIRKGIALGVLLFGAYGLMMETLSMKQNRAYLEKIKGYQVSTKKQNSE